VPVRPVRLAAALVGLAVTAAMTGCAGSAPAAEPSRDSSAATSVTSAPADPASATGRRIEVEVTGDRVSGDTGRVVVPAGEQVTLAVTSDVADEVHVHGYDLTAEMVPGEPEELTFTATIPGVFEVELHDAGTVLLSLQVG
jgi:plastocyanin